MADETTATTAPTPADMPQQKNPAADNEAKAGIEALPEWAQKEIKSVREEAAKYRTRAKEFADDSVYERAKAALEQLDKIEESSKSEAQKLTEEKEKLLYEASSAKEQLMRIRTAVKAGFSGDEAEDIASRLRGDDEDEFLEDAKKLRELIKPSGKRPDPSQGAVPGGGSPGEILGAEIAKRLR